MHSVPIEFYWLSLSLSGGSLSVHEKPKAANLDFRLVNEQKVTYGIIYMSSSALFFNFVYLNLQFDKHFRSKYVHTR